MATEGEGRAALARGMAYRVNGALRELGWSKSELARRAGLSGNIVYSLCRADGLPSLWSAVEIARALGMTADELLGTERPRRAEPRGTPLTISVPSGEGMDLDAFRMACAYGLRRTAGPHRYPPLPMWDEECPYERDRKLVAADMWERGATAREIAEEIGTSEGNVWCMASSNRDMFPRRREWGGEPG